MSHWFKGSLHTHTSGAGSTGDASPESVARWYRRHDYDFLSITDHDVLTAVDDGPSNGLLELPLLIPGEEISARIKNGAIKIHVNGIGISATIDPIDSRTGGPDEVVPTLQANIDAILESGGIAMINHPNYTWAVDHKSINQTTGATLLEVYNGGGASKKMDGGPGRFTYEQIWDGVLSAGRVIYGVATDDAHKYSVNPNPDPAHPGTGWVMVRAIELSAKAIITALASGDFYASTGVTLKELEASRECVHVEVEEVGDYVYITQFVGRDGKVLAEVVGPDATYRPRGDEGYVRAVVSIASSKGTRAWTQPVFLELFCSA